MANSHGTGECSKSDGQEQFVTKLLKTRDGGWLRGGMFLEMGGGDGIKQSNTFALESCLGWHGILIEPNPHLSKRICTNRPRALSYSLAVSLTCNRSAVNATCSQGTMAFDVSSKIIAGRLTESWTTAGDPSLLNAEMKLMHSKAFKVDHLCVPCAPLRSLLSLVPHIDYLSLDLEGAEAVVLQTIDWTRLSVHVLGVEQSSHAIEKNAAVRDQLRTQGFVHVFTHWAWKYHVGNELFVNGSYLRRNLRQVAEAVDPMARMGNLSWVGGGEGNRRQRHAAVETLINIMRKRARRVQLYGNRT